MRLWHQVLIPHLPRQQLLGLHRECCALRGAGWGRKHATVDYVFTHEPAYLMAYHDLIMNEMEDRGYHPNEIWRDNSWRGNKIGYDDDFVNNELDMQLNEDVFLNGTILYPEHNEAYLQECIDNLKQKGIEIDEMD